jgi:hypothetical protein
MTATSRAAQWGLGLVLTVVLATTAHAEPLPLSKEEQAKVDRAIDKAVTFLKRTQTKAGDWTQPPKSKEHQHPLGATALPALALLEAGVPANDPAVQRTAEWMRPHLSKLDRTYELSLALLLLDRLGNPQDKAAIRSLALRLIAGQCRTGGWGYRCPTLSPQNEGAFPDLLRQWEEAAANQKAPPDLPPPFKVLTVFQDPDKLPWLDGDPPSPPGAHHGWHRLTEHRLFLGDTDNSNTQFAILALWAARRHDVPVGPTLRLAARRFESSQNDDGTWYYLYRRSGGFVNDRGTRAMTTVGLLGLALREGLRPGKAIPAAAPDSRVLRGLAAVSCYVGEPSGQMKQRVPMTDLYYLWSLARLGMLYDLPTVGGKDWYRWGAEMLITNQTPRGDWGSWDFGPYDLYEDYGPTINTSFALLFLKRSHLLKDLTARLPYKPDALEKGIAAVLQGGRLPPAARIEPNSKKP